MEKKWHSGTVVHGNANGRKWNYPTINLANVEPALAVENGVYAVVLQLSEKELFQGMLYVGTRPTLKLSERVFEIHLFDYQGDLYEQTVSFRIVKRVRGEMQFDSVTALAKQLSEDEKNIRLLLNAEF
ncbi:MAG: riboflavin kinase [Bacteroidales bacterium]|nr:riboflavin kinase [Bacteroidales bacterium]